MTNNEQAAYLLHSRPFRDNQSIVELLTEFDGKVSAVVYLSKSLKSNKKALLQPFSPLNVLLKGKSNLKTLSLVESTAKSFQLSGNYLYSGFYINELLVKLLPELIPCPTLYDDYQSLLLTFNQQKMIERPLRTFETQLLNELGVAFDFEQAMECENDKLHFVPGEGFSPVTGNMHGNQYQIYAKSDILAIGQGCVSARQELLTWKRLMRQMINHLLGNKPLNSRKLFEKMR